MRSNYLISDELKSMINNERVVWAGKPLKKCFILECVFNSMLPFALIWALFDFTFIFASLNSEMDSSIDIMLIGFFAIHLMPVWLYLGGVLCSFRKFKNTEYAITERGIYVTSGCFSKQYNFKPFTDLSHVDVYRGIFDQKLGVGDVITTCHHYGNYNGRHSSSSFRITDIPDYIEVCNLIKQYQTDIYADTQYPNDFRPQGNHGYRTNYYPDSNADANPQNYYRPNNNPNNGYYGNQYSNQNYNSATDFYREQNAVHNGYEANGGNNNRDSWDN